MVQTLELESVPLVEISFLDISWLIGGTGTQSSFLRAPLAGRIRYRT
jgi:hypothetical protein